MKLSLSLSLVAPLHEAHYTDILPATIESGMDLVSHNGQTSHKSTDRTEQGITSNKFFVPNMWIL